MESRIAFKFFLTKDKDLRNKHIRKALALCGNISKVSPFKLWSFKFYPETMQRTTYAVSVCRRRWLPAFIKWLHVGLFLFKYNGHRKYFLKHPQAVAICWNGLTGSSRNLFMAAAKDSGARTLFFERAPFPQTLAADPCGVNFKNCLPRESRYYEKWLAANPKHSDCWQQVKKQVQQREVHPWRKIRFGGKTDKRTLPTLQNPFIFVPLQVYKDSQLRFFGGAFKTSEKLVETLVAIAPALPQGWHFRIKEHPSSKRSIAAWFIKNISSDRVYLDNRTDTFEQVQSSRGVLTINSSVGLEAMLYDKPVVACGQCFWAWENIAYYAPDRPALEKLFSAPEKLTFDKRARNAFLSFLVQEYYLSTVAINSPDPEIQLKEVSKLIRRLEPNYPQNLIQSVVKF